MHNKKTVDIYGAGFSGLVQAFYLVEAGYHVRIHEKNKEVGGLIGSHFSNGFLVEQGANAFLANKELESLCEKISVPLVSVKSEAKKRFIYKNNKMLRWPLSFKESLFVPRFLYNLKWGQKKVAAYEGETLREWGIRNLGDGGSNNLLEPAMQGVYATTSDELDASLILSSLFNKREKGKLRGSVAPAGGMSQWLKSLVTYLESQDCEFYFSSSFESLSSESFNILAFGLSELKSLVVNKKLIFVPKFYKRSFVH